MSQLPTTLQPYGLLVSRVMRDGRARSPSNYEGSFEIYVGAPEWTVGAQATEKLRVELPLQWKPHIEGIFAVRSPKSERLRQYSSERYVVKFTTGNVP